MPSVIATINMQIPGGPQLDASNTLPIEAYDRIEVDVNPGDTKKVISIQPGSASQLRALVIKSSIYDDSGKVTYAVSSGGSDSHEVNLDGPQVFLGPGALSLFGVDPPVALKVTNGLTAAPGTDKKVHLEILIGRDATP
jgi:hypothetical protein